MADGVIPSAELGQLNSLIRRLEDRLGSRLEPSSGQGSSSPILELEDLTPSSELSLSYLSCWTPSDSWIDPNTAELSISVISSLLAAGHSLESPTAVEDEVEAGDAGGDGEGEDDSRGHNGGILPGGELGA